MTKFYHDRGYPKCPDCGLDNYVYGSYYKNGRDGAVAFGYYWNGPSKALDAGHYANLWTKKGRIYGGPRKKHQRWSQGSGPVRVNERKWKIQRSGIRLLVACANKFHSTPEHKS